MRSPSSTLVVFLVAPAIAIGDVQIACGDLGVSVLASTQAEAQRTCESVKQADRRLRELDLWHEGDLIVEVTDELGEGLSSCVAAYDARSFRLEILSETCLSESAAKTDAFPDMPVDVRFDSLIQHELTHAYVTEALGGHFLPRAAHEYLAYAVQVDALPETIRSALLADAEVTYPVVVTELNESILYFAPGRFAAAAWIFFRQNGGGAEAVSDVLTRQLRFPQSR